MPWSRRLLRPLPAPALGLVPALALVVGLGFSLGLRLDVGLSLALGRLRRGLVLGGSLGLRGLGRSLNLSLHRLRLVLGLSLGGGVDLGLRLVLRLDVLHVPGGGPGLDLGVGGHVGPWLLALGGLLGGLLGDRGLGRGATPAGGGTPCRTV